MDFILINSTTMTAASDLLDRLQLPGGPGYARVRRDYQAFVSRIKARRRIRLGAHAALLFENDETVRAQILEVLHVEGRTPARLARVTAEYACLLPETGELRATLFIDGIDRRLARQIGEAACAAGGITVYAGDRALRSAPAEGESAVADPAAPDSCVHYLALRPAREVNLVGDGVGERARWGVRVATPRPFIAPIDEPLRGELLADLVRGDSLADLVRGDSPAPALDSAFHPGESRRARPDVHQEDTPWRF